MKTNEFIQIINATFYISKNEPKLLDIVLQIDSLRKLHSRLQQKLEYLLTDNISYESNIEREKIKSIAIEIRQYANEYKIQVNFEKLPNEFIEFSKQFRDKKSFAKYFYNTTNITKLIVFTEFKKEKKQTKKEIIRQEINEIQFQQNFSVLDENGKNLNEIPGVNL